MEDSRIVELYWQRDEAAIAETEKKYGRYCLSIAKNILFDREDSEECVNDALLGAWNAIPPHKPAMLSVFLGKITRRTALKKLRAMSAIKRGGNSRETSLDELEELIPSGKSIDEEIEGKALTELINGFLDKLPAAERRVFLRRYWYFDSVKAIAERYGYSESKVKVMLKRTRDKLRVRLAEEGIWV